jgi:hypothetical protein
MGIEGIENAHKAAERVARERYGRLLAFLAARTRDVAGAEDAWPMPSRPRCEHGPSAAFLPIRTPGSSPRHATVRPMRRAVARHGK